VVDNGLVYPNILVDGAIGEAAVVTAEVGRVVADEVDKETGAMLVV
jgi:hypothetical protein